MIFHLIVNSILVFIVLAFLIEIIIAVFRVKNARVRYCFRLIPLLKFPFDLIIFLLLGNSFFHNYNPFSCEFEVINYVQTALSLDFPVSDQQPFLIPQYIASFLPETLLNIFLGIAIITSISIFLLKFTQLIRSNLYLDHLLKKAKPVSKRIVNPKLAMSVSNFGAVILTSDAMSVPFAARQKFIFIPKRLMDAFSQDEFEAVVAHELEHLRWKDPLLRLFSNFLCATFWWIPSGWYIKKLEEDQEQASDDTIHKYLIDSYALGSALVKTIKGAKQDNLHKGAICPLTTASNVYHRRLNHLLNPRRSQNVFLTVLAGISSISVFLSFWAC